MLYYILHYIHTKTVALVIIRAIDCDIITRPCVECRDLAAESHAMKILYNS